MSVTPLRPFARSRVWAPTATEAAAFDRTAIEQVRPDCWHVMGMTSVRRLARHFKVELPSTRGVTVAGVLQDLLERLPEGDDQCDWGPFHFRVLETPARGHLRVELTMRDGQGEGPG